MRRNLPFLALTAIVLSLLVSLGNWQVRRLAEKTAYIAEIESKLTAAPVAPPKNARPEADQFTSVIAEGRFVGPEVHMLVSTRDYGAGYRIIQAFEFNNRRLMVDRGYIRLESKDAPRPAVYTTVLGNLHWPSERDQYTPEDDVQANIWYARDVPKLAAELGAEPLLIIARQSTPRDGTILPLPVDTSSIPNRHLEYIITWYGLAAVWVLMTIYFLTRRSRKGT
ncbi:SURF1 family protein [Lentibacter algarum]|uniref:SURF1 family protein n=1 Tax=Lentibacter algarum TaxID=576131 RepID=UPI001C0892EC|nr:SURF1 family protein [Lentibacter algarum]MBU2982956.1 SURF1 family protein [Lentibacter algarum]